MSLWWSQRRSCIGPLWSPPSSGSMKFMCSTWFHLFQSAVRYTAEFSLTWNKTTSEPVCLRLFPAGHSSVVSVLRWSDLSCPIACGRLAPQGCCWRTAWPKVSSFPLSCVWEGVLWSSYSSGHAAITVKISISWCKRNNQPHADTINQCTRRTEICRTTTLRQPVCCPEKKSVGLFVPLY